MIARIGTLALLVLIHLPAATVFAYSGSPSSKTTSYDFGETAEVSLYGVTIEISPEVTEFGTIGFFVKCTYTDPFARNAPTITFLPTTLLQTDCEYEETEKRWGPYKWCNDRDTCFAVTFVKRCKHNPNGPEVPFLDADVWCSNPDLETRIASILEDGELFDIRPIGDTRNVKTTVGYIIDGLDIAFQVVGVVRVVLDVIAVVDKRITVGKFIVSTAIGLISDRLSKEGFEYFRGEYGWEARFFLTGWAFRCRLCGYEFSLTAIGNNQLVVCPGCGVGARIKP